MILYRTAEVLFVEHEGKAYRLSETSVDALIAHNDLHGHLLAQIARSSPTNDLLHAKVEALPPIAAYLQSPRRIAFNQQGIFRHYAELDA